MPDINQSPDAFKHIQSIPANDDPRFLPKTVNQLERDLQRLKRRYPCDSLVREIYEQLHALIREVRTAFRRGQLDGEYQRIRTRLHAIAEGLCGKCGKVTLFNARRGDMLKYEMDHIIDIDFGGETTWGNVQVFCRKCHREKTNARRGGDKRIKFWDRRSLELIVRCLAEAEADLARRQLSFFTEERPDAA